MSNKEAFIKEKAAIIRGGQLHWYHWLVVGLSLLLTCTAWYISKNNIDERTKVFFERDADQVVELVVERMLKYEDALWSGVAAIQSHGGDMTHDQWIVFAESLRIDVKYPGINGIGVIHHVLPETLSGYLEQQRISRPDYGIHPAHKNAEYLPISYIEPVKDNIKAVGLDMAHEANRYSAALKARDEGGANITGPIVLVQDEGGTPGFLFFAPFYKGKKNVTLEDRRANFTGIVYAPFVVEKLLEGTLKKDRRRVGIQFLDGADILHDELNGGESDFDPDPMYKKSVSLELYGRHWVFNIWSSESFRKETSNHQPLIILIGGIVIDTMLLILFLFVTRSNKRALSFAERMSQSYNDKAKELSHLVEILSQSNKELDQFAYIASHDLKEPLRGISSYAQFLSEDYADKLDDDGVYKLKTLVKLSERMDKLISDLLHVSRLGRTDLKLVMVDMDRILKEDVLDNLEFSIQEKNIQIRIDRPLPQYECDPLWIKELWQNLISNAVKYNDKSDGWVEIGYKESENEDTVFYVKDNGIGIPEKHKEDIFNIFKRLHASDKFGGGSGAGLFIARKIVDRHNGRMWVESNMGEGTTVYFTLKGVDV